MGDIQICNEVRALPGLLGDLNHIQSFIRRLSAPAEFCLVLSVGFGPFILAQPWALNHLPSAPQTCSKLVEGSDGAPYGTTTQGTFTPGRFGGTVFRVTTNGWFSGLYSFAEPDGRWSDMALTLGSDGAFYLTTFPQGLLQ